MQIGGNVLNTGHLIEDLPRAGLRGGALPGRTAPASIPPYVGHLPPVLAAMNMTNINTQLLTIEAARTRKKEDILPGCDAGARTPPPSFPSTTWRR